MPTVSAERRRRRWRRWPASAAILAGLVLPACSADPPPPSGSAPGGNEQVALLVQDALTTRAAALRNRNERRFRRTLDRSNARLVQEQAVYFANIGQLPVGELSLDVDELTLTPVEGSGDYWAEVVTALRLDGYDAVPARTRDRFLFTPSADGARFLVASTTDHAWETGHPGNAQPWDLAAVQVRQDAGVLGIFDDRSVSDAGGLLQAASVGRYDVRSALGVAAAVDSGVVIYAVSDPAFLRGLADQTVGDPERADGLTIAVPADTADQSQGVVGYRIHVNPRVLDEPDVVVGRLVRHELTHATLGPRGAGAPLWLTEGVAEYVSVRAIPPDRRRLPDRALTVGASATDLPGPDEFASGDAEAWYGVSWWVCEYIAATHGVDVLLLLLDELDDGVDQDEVLARALGLSGSELVQRGAALMSTTYDG